MDKVQYLPQIITALATLITALAGLVSSLRNRNAIQSLHDCLDEHREAVGRDMAELKEAVKETK